MAGGSDKSPKASRLAQCGRVVALGALTFLLGLLAGSSLAGSTGAPPPSAGERKPLCATPAAGAAFSTSLVHNVPALYERYADLLEGVITGRMFPEQGACSDHECSSIVAFDLQQRLAGDDYPPTGLSMIGTYRMRNLKQAIEHVVAAGIEGDFAELGSWRGGAGIFMRAMADALQQSHRHVYLFDAFDTLVKQYLSTGMSKFLSVPADRVRASLERFGAAANVSLVPGLFRQTVPAWRAAHLGQHRLALLRLDGNSYSSYQSTLYNTYDFVPVGGVVIFDDIFSHAGAQYAWKDFQEDHGFAETMLHVNAQHDKSGGWFIKTKDVKVDFSKMRAERRIEGGILIHSDAIPE